jgi:hypothetical protein
MPHDTPTSSPAVEGGRESTRHAVARTEWTHAQPGFLSGRAVRLMAAKRSRAYTPSLVIGLLLVPVSAVAAFALVANQPTDIGTEPMMPVTTVAAPVAATTAPARAATPSPAGPDLAAACGEDGMKLIDAETDGTITDLEQAALDALRPICADAGMELPAPPAPAPVIRTVRVTSEGSGTAAPSDDGRSNDGHDEDDDDHYEDDDHEDDDDDHDEDDEDDDHEDDDDDDHEDDD